MIAAAIVLAALLLIAILYVLSTMGRKGHPDLPKLRGCAYAHRGLHGNGVPENSMEAFRRAKKAGYGIYNIMLQELFQGTPSADVASWCAKAEKEQTKRVETLAEFFEEHRP